MHFTKFEKITLADLIKQEKEKSIIFGFWFWYYGLKYKIKNRVIRHHKCES